MLEAADGQLESAVRRTKLAEACSARQSSQERATPLRGCGNRLACAAHAFVVQAEKEEAVRGSEERPYVPMEVVGRADGDGLGMVHWCVQVCPPAPGHGALVRTRVPACPPCCLACLLCGELGAAAGGIRSSRHDVPIAGAAGSWTAVSVCPAALASSAGMLRTARRWRNDSRSPAPTCAIVACLPICSAQHLPTRPCSMPYFLLLLLTCA